MERQYSEKGGRKIRFRRRFDWDSSGRVLFYSVVVGFLAGVAAVLAYCGYQFLGDVVRSFYEAAGIELPRAGQYTAQSGPLPGEVFIDAERKDVLFGFLTVPRYCALMLLIPSFGGLLCGFLIWSLAPEANGEGTDTVIRAFHSRNGFLRNRISIVKTLASFLTLGSGGSAGWEGPTMLLGAGIASSVGRKLRLTVKDRRVLLLAGAAAGIGAIFQIPFGGALFAVEILYASTALEFTALLPCVIASLVGYSTFRFFHGEIRPIEIPSTVGIHHPTDILIFIVFVPVIALCGLFFVRMILELRNRVFRRMRIPEFFKPALGGFLLGCVALICPQVLGGGYEWMYRLMEGQLPFLLIVMLIVPKMLATALTVSSGGSGGLLVPSLFIGGLIGGALGHSTGMVFTALGVPGWSPDVVTCVLIGMGTFYAGIGKVPLAAAVIVCELAGGDFTLLAPLVLLNLIHIAIQSFTTSLYEEQVLAPIDSEAHFGNYSVDLLRALTVCDACESGNAASTPVLTVPENASIPEAVKLISSDPASLFPVLDAEGRYIGVIQAGDVWSVFRNRRKWANYTAKDLTQQKEITVCPQDDLYKALRLCTHWNITELPVVDPENPGKLLGILRHQDILAAYNSRLAVAQWS